MQIVINIPEELYDKLMTEQSLPEGYDAEYPIIHGIPLPKGHGRLIDVEWVKKYYPLEVDGLDLRGNNQGLHTAIDDAPTVIEADRRTKNDK